MSAREFYGIKNMARFKVQRAAVLPTWTTADKGRIVYDLATDQAYYGGETGWIVAQAQHGGSLGKYNWYPEILTSDNKLARTISTGQIVVDSGQNFFMRSSLYDTDDFSAGSRTFTTLASKTYHLRFVHDVTASGSNLGATFYATKGIVAGQFYLVQTGDAAYNPSTLAETNATFDSKYDDMLIAKVVTDASNVLTVTLFANKDFLQITGQIAQDVPFLTSRNWTNWTTISIAWARTPGITPIGLSMFRTRTLSALALGNTITAPNLEAIGTRLTDVTRYGATAQYLYDVEQSYDGYLIASWMMMA